MNSLSFCFALLRLAVSPVVAQTSNLCSDYVYPLYEYVQVDYDWDDYYYSYFFLKFEDALIKDHKQLEELRPIFMNSAAVSVNLHASMSAKDVKNDINCPYDDNLTFCLTAPHRWDICDYCSLHNMTLVQTELKLAATEKSIFQLMIYVCFIHGSLLPAYWPTYFENFWPFERDRKRNGEHIIELKLDHLTCNPPCPLTRCVLSEMFIWLKQYSYSQNGHKPHNWPESEKGAMEHNMKKERFYPLKFIKQSVDADVYIKLSTAQYVLISLSLSLVIAIYFPAIHKHLVSKVTKLEHQCLYWGTVIIFNAFTYSLLFLAGRGFCLFMLYIDLESSAIKWKSMFYTLFIQEVVLNIILFVGALVASLRGHGGTCVPIPNGMAKIIIYVSFFFTCFCCCVGCSPRCKAKPLRVLIMFSFMSFIYHIIMDFIAVVFLLFIPEARTSVVTFTLLYISLLIFLVQFASYFLLSLFRGRSSTTLRWHQCLNCFGGAFVCITVFSALVLMIVSYMIIVFSLNLQGVSGIVTGLIPSIALSSISWYIKKRLFNKEPTNSSSSGPSELQTEPGANGGENDEKKEDGRLLLP